MNNYGYYTRRPSKIQMSMAKRNYRDRLIRLDHVSRTVKCSLKYGK